MQIKAEWLRIIGFCSLALSVIGALLALTGTLPTDRELSGYLFASGLMAVVSAGLIVAAKLRRQNDPLAEKVVPSSLVAYLLFLVMTYHWYNS